MENPWINLKKDGNNEYIAESDRNYIHYLRNSLKGDYELKLRSTPGPYTGNPFKAVVYVLALNPGYSEGIDEEISINFEDMLLKNLSHIFDEWPFIALNPIFKSNNRGYMWWMDKLRYLIRNTDIKTVSNFVFNAEYFPYHSKKYMDLKQILPSQEYTFYLVKKAISDNKSIIIMRSERFWYKAIPELEKYEKKYVLRSPQNVVISEKNMGGYSNFSKIIIEIKEAVNKSKNYSA